MATITEDYVSFETAKLLKEKGCKCQVHTWYNQEHKICHLKFDIEDVDCPTLYDACKWLREVHNLNVEVYRTACGYIGCIVAIPSGTDIKFLEDDGDDKASGTYTKPELAYEATIKYCLEHLI